MNNDSLFLLMDLVVVLFGVYGMAEWIKLKRAGHLIDSKLFFPSGCTVATCKDPEGFYAYILPRFFGFCCLAVVGGAFSVANDYWKLFGTVGTLITMAVFFLIIVVYGIMTKQAFKRYFQ